MDVERARLVDVREVARRLIGEPERDNGLYAMYRSPLRDDGDTASFAVYADHYYDFGGENASGDGIDLVMRVAGIGFKEAVALILNEQVVTPLPQRERVRVARGVLDAPGADWQDKAWGVIDRAQRNLWSETGQRALAYLQEWRGLKDEIIRDARLGYVPGGYTQFAEVCGLRVPCGIVMPWVIDGEVWQLKVRRAAGTPKYQQAAGGSAHGLYRIDRVNEYDDVLIVEGEFDALVVAQETKLVAAVALGRAGNRIAERWMPKLLTAGRIYARLDDDAAGRKGVARLREQSERVRPVCVPEGWKDVNEFWMGDADGFRQWVRTLASWKIPHPLTPSP